MTTIARLLAALTHPAPSAAHGRDLFAEVVAEAEAILESEASA